MDACSHGPAGKFGGLFASMPQAMVSGLFAVMFGIIAVRLSSPTLSWLPVAVTAYLAKALAACVSAGFVAALPHSCWLLRGYRRSDSVNCSMWTKTGGQYDGTGM
jgi:hypothetical protein